MTSVNVTGSSPLQVSVQTGAPYQVAVQTSVPLPPVAGPPGVNKDVVENLASESEYIGVWSIEGTATDESEWPGRMMVIYNKATGDSVATFVLDQYGQPRATSAAEDTVALKLYAKQFTADTDHEITVPVLAMYDNQDDENLLFAVYPDGTVYCKEVIEFAP